MAELPKNGVQITASKYRKYFSAKMICNQSVFKNLPYTHCVTKNDFTNIDLQGLIQINRRYSLANENTFKKVFLSLLPYIYTMYFLAFFIHRSSIDIGLIDLMQR